jgi:hypothetical protein
MKLSRALLLAGLWLACAAGTCQASALRFCDVQNTATPEQKDRLFRFSALIKSELEASGQAMALVSRSGLDLSRFGQRYSHAGVSLKGNLEVPWAVRQLYYACEEDRPRIYDQGMSGFLLGTDDADVGYLSVVFLPGPEGAPLAQAMLDNRLALAPLSTAYSANAYPFSLRYQNCNQWVMEMLAMAWGALDTDGPAGATREQAQRWLQAQGYTPTVIEVGNPLLMWAGLLLPWVHRDDHPPEDVAQRRFRVSMPASMEGFVRERVPGATRLEFCHDRQRMVVHRGWEPIEEGCTPGEGDLVIPFES